MPSLNKVLLMGHAGKDAEKKYLPSGVLTTNFSIATTEHFQKDGQWTDKTDWHNISVFGDKAEYASQVQKGELVLVEGKISTRSWTDPQGNKRYATDIIANSVKRIHKNEQVESSEESDSFDDEPAPSPSVDSEDDASKDAEVDDLADLGM